MFRLHGHLAQFGALAGSGSVENDAKAAAGTLSSMNLRQRLSQESAIRPNREGSSSRACHAAFKANRTFALSSVGSSSNRRELSPVTQRSRIGTQRSVGKRSRSVVVRWVRSSRYSM